MANQIQTPAAEVTEVVHRLRDAINDHDLEALVGCFAEKVRSRQPAHPSRAFEGNQNVRQNWTMILGGVPDLKAEILRSTVDGETAWVEWHWAGTGRDGRTFEMRGVTVQEIGDGAIQAVNLYMEPVEAEGAGNAGAIKAAVGAGR